MMAVTSSGARAMRVSGAVDLLRMRRTVVGLCLRSLAPLFAVRGLLEVPADECPV